MRVLCFSSFSFGYLNRARILFESLRRHQPEWELVALVADKPPPSLALNVGAEPFDSVHYAEGLDIPQFRSWMFKHDLIEACTAVKGLFLQTACSSGADAVVDPDPDTCLFGSLSPVEKLLEDYDVVLTPHTVTPTFDPQAVIDNEICSLKTGAFNLGFCAIRTTGEGRRFADWWADRLLNYCYDDIPNGLFVDQRWCDLAPALFDNVKILRDPGYNVASWNLVDRKLEIGPEGATVNGSPLRFWQFTKLGRIADVMTKRYAGDNFPVYELWTGTDAKSSARRTHPSPQTTGRTASTKTASRSSDRTGCCIAPIRTWKSSLPIRFAAAADRSTNGYLKSANRSRIATAARRE